jgi:Protein of unknown function (DUF2690)
VLTGGSPASAASCSSNPYQDTQIIYTVSYTATLIELRYSPTCRTAWAHEVHGLPGDHLWVYNRDTGATKETWINNGSTSASTGAVSDAGTESHACMQASDMPKTCTSYY